MYGMSNNNKQHFGDGSAQKKQICRASLSLPNGWFRRHRVDLVNKPSPKMMPASPSDVGHSSIPAPKQGSLTTRIIAQHESKMSRTTEVKMRLGPIMERMKSSLAKIQSLEESLSLSAEGESRERSTETSSSTGASLSPLHKSNTLKFIPGSNKSRQLLKSSMEMLKKKLTTLQIMEETLNTSEDRRQNLQHYFLQTSLSKPMLELAATKRRNQELERDLECSEEEKKHLEEKCSNVEYLKKRVTSLSDSLQKLSGVEAELLKAQEQSKAYEQDLQERQAKIDELSMKCDDLECQVDQLSGECDRLRQSLREEQERNKTLEVGDSNLLRALSPQLDASVHCVKGAKESVDGQSTAPTVPDTDSLTHQSSFVDETGSEGEVHGSKDSSIDSSISQDDLMNLLDFVDTSRLTRFDDDDISSTLTEGQGIAMIQKLVAKIEKMDKENAELRALHRVSNVKLSGLMVENTQQASRLQALEQQQMVTRPGSSSPKLLSPKTTRGSFFGFLKHDPPNNKKLSKVEKARLISEGLTMQLRGKE